MNKRVVLPMIIMIMICIGAVAMNMFDKKPFRFEYFKSKEDAKAFFNKKYPKGSSSAHLINDAKKSGQYVGFLLNMNLISTQA